MRRVIHTVKPKSITLALVYCLASVFVGVFPLISCRNSSLSPIDQWATAMFVGDYETAEKLMDVSNFSAWRATTEALNKEHGGFKSYQRNTSPEEPEVNDTTVLILTWNDGTTRCISLQTTSDGHVTPLSGTYELC